MVKNGATKRWEGRRSFCRAVGKGDQPPSTLLESAEFPAVMAWYADWEARKDLMVRDGLPLYIREVRINPGEWGFIAVYVDIADELLPRSAAGYELHYSLGYLKALTDRGHPEQAIRDLVAELNRRYAGKTHVARIGHMSCGGTAVFHPDEALLADPIIDFITSRGGFEWKAEPHHISL